MRICTGIITHPLLLPEILARVGQFLLPWTDMDRNQWTFLPQDLVACLQVCRTWHLTLTPLLWQTFDSSAMAHIPREILIKNSVHFRRFKKVGSQGLLPAASPEQGDPNANAVIKASSLLHCRNLTRISLDHWNVNINDDGTVDLDNWSGNQSTQMEQQEQVQVITHLLRSNPGIQHLEARGQGYRGASQKMLPRLHYKPLLELSGLYSLKLVDWDLDSAQILRLLGQNKGLKDLSLRYVGGLSGPELFTKAVSKVDMSLQDFTFSGQDDEELRFPWVKSLNMDINGEDRGSALMLLECFPGLERLVVHGQEECMDSHDLKELSCKLEKIVGLKALAFRTPFDLWTDLGCLSDGELALLVKSVQSKDRSHSDQNSNYPPSSLRVLYGATFASGSPSFPTSPIVETRAMTGLVELSLDLNEIGDELTEAILQWHCHSLETLELDQHLYPSWSPEHGADPGRILDSEKDLRNVERLLRGLPWLKSCFLSLFYDQVGDSDESEVKVSTIGRTETVGQDDGGMKKRRENGLVKLSGTPWACRQLESLTIEYCTGHHPVWPQWLQVEDSEHDDDDDDDDGESGDSGEIQTSGALWWIPPLRKGSSSFGRWNYRLQVAMVDQFEEQLKFLSGLKEFSVNGVVARKKKETKKEAPV